MQKFLSKIFTWFLQTPPVRGWNLIFGVFSVPAIIYLSLAVGNGMQSEFGAMLAWICATAVCFLAHAHTKVIQSFAKL